MFGVLVGWRMNLHGLNSVTQTNPSYQQMVCWAEADAEPVAADDAKDIRWMTLPQLRGVNVRPVFFYLNGISMLC